MPSVTIDAGVLATPPVGADYAAISHYVETLLDWRQLLDEPWVAIYMSARASETLLEDGLYPLRDALKTSFTSQGVVEYDANTVAQVAETLLRLTPHFEAVFRISDVLYTDLSTEPDLLAIATTQFMVSDLARCVLLFALLRVHCLTPLTDHALIVRPWPGRPMLHVKALVHDFEHERDDVQPIPKPPQFFEGTVWVCQSFRELIEGLVETDIWQSAQDDAGHEIAVQVALYQYRLERGLDPEWDDWPAYSFGRKFVTRFNQVCLGQPDKIRPVIRAMVETLDAQLLAKVHALRVDDSGGSPPRMRGTERGQRRDIDSDTHLHYWQGSQNIEFGWVSYPHNDFTLPE